MRFHTRTLLIIALVISTVSWPARAQAQAWAPLTSTEGRFTVQMPGTPVLTTQNDSTPVGAIQEHTYTVTGANQSFTVNYQDIPELAVMFGGAGRIYTGARNGFLKDSGSTEVTYSQIQVGSHGGFQLLFTTPASGTTPALQGKTWLTLIGRRLYVVTASWPQNGSSTNADTFFNSFQITP